MPDMDTNLNPDFINMLSKMPGHEQLADVLVSTPSPVSIRLNPHKTSSLYTEISDSTPWEPMGRYLAERPFFSHQPELYDGRFYVQDSSSMITGEALRRIVKLMGDRPLKYLDACAAPGGKATAALANLPEGSFLLANEYDAGRLGALIENLERWGATNYAVSRNDARQLGKATEMFDIVAADVPCSGEGMMRKNITARTQWSERLINECAELQRSIVKSVWDALRPGGYLIYSTCTFNVLENERNAEWIRDTLKAQPVDLGLADFPGVLTGLDTSVPCIRLIPGHVRGEGQFLAVFRKTEGGASTNPRNKKHTEHNNSGTFKSIQHLIDKPELYTFTSNPKGEIYITQTLNMDYLNRLSRQVNIVVPGVHVASPKGKDYMPAHALATSQALNSSNCPTTDVPLEVALSFLNGQAITPDSDMPLGYVLVKCGNNNLGWVKNIGKRANNLVPSNRRLRKLSSEY